MSVENSIIYEFAVKNVSSFLLDNTQYSGTNSDILKKLIIIIHDVANKINNKTRRAGRKGPI